MGLMRAARLDVTFGDDQVPALVFVRVRDGLLAEITDFWPTSYDPPADRAHLAERETG